MRTKHNSYNNHKKHKKLIKIKIKRKLKMKVRKIFHPNKSNNKMNKEIH